MKIKQFLASFIASMLLAGGALSMALPQDQAKTPTEEHAKKSKTKKAAKDVEKGTEKAGELAGEGAKDTAKGAKKAGKSATEKTKKDKTTPEHQ